MTTSHNTELVNDCLRPLCDISALAIGFEEAGVWKSIYVHWPEIRTSKIHCCRGTIGLGGIGPVAGRWHSDWRWIVEGRLIPLVFGGYEIACRGVSTEFDGIRRDVSKKPIRPGFGIPIGLGSVMQPIAEAHRIVNVHEVDRLFGKPGLHCVAEIAVLAGSHDAPIDIGAHPGVVEVVEAIRFCSRIEEGRIFCVCDLIGAHLVFIDDSSEIAIRIVAQVEFLPHSHEGRNDQG